MKNYRYLNITENPIKDMAHLTSQTITGGYNIHRPGDFIKDEVLDLFRNLGLRPKFLSIFGRNDSESTFENRIIHSDLSKDPNVPEGWRRAVCGVNWELNGTENEFFWFDTSKLKECWPAEILPHKYDYLNGIHYGKRGQFGIDNAICIESTFINQPTLVRTDVPHLTNYKNKSNKRFGVSLRFHEEDFNHSWENVLQILSPIIK